MRCVWLLTLALLLTGCGAEEPSAPDRSPAIPSTPEDALAWVREAADDEPELRARLAAWPMDAQDFAESEESRIVITWRLRMALQEGDVETALRRHHMLEDLFDGEGRSPEGRLLPSEVIAGSIFDESLLRARLRMEGAKPDLESARQALEIARETADHDDTEATSRIEETVAWIELTHIRDLAAPLKFPRAIETGPRIVVLADDFALGEAVFISVLERWQRDGRAAGVAVELVPVITGQVRMGIRRVPADSTRAERATIRQRAQKAGLAISRAVPKGIPAAALQAIGLGPQATALLIVNTEGKIIARESGKNIDPRALDLAVERLISR